MLQEPDRARASVSLYRTFLLHELSDVIRGRYRRQRLTVPTRLLGGSADPVITPQLLRGYELFTDDMTIDVLEDVGHVLPEEAPEVVAAGCAAAVRARQGCRPSMTPRPDAGHGR